MTDFDGKSYNIFSVIFIMKFIVVVYWVKLIWYLRSFDCIQSTRYNDKDTFKRKKINNICCKMTESKNIKSNYLI